MAFDYETGNLVDTAFIRSDFPRLQSPKHAIQRSVSEALVSDQLSDVVQLYDTTGFFKKTFAPAGGLNNNILDNIRGIAYKPNGNLLVTNASGSAANRIQEFDTAGVFVGSFISTVVNSPFSILYRDSDILIGNSSGTNKILRFDFNGNYIASFTTTSLNFIQQLIKNPNGNIVACEFSGTGTGLKIFDSTGVLLTTLTGATGNRGVFRLPNGNYMTTNSSGVYEIDATTGSLVRSIYLGGNLHYIDVFDKSTGTLITANMNYNQGWNLFSVPLLTSNMSVNQITPNRTSFVFHYNQRYNIVDTLQNGKAYWVKYNSNTTVPISGNLPLENVIPVNQGWNLVGPFNTIIPVSAITTNPPNIIVSLFYGFNNGYAPASELLPSKGYWVKVNQNGSLIFPTQLIKSSVDLKSFKELEQLGKITITDQIGNIATLYITSNQFDNSKYQLPPVPPADVFDVRFSTDNLVENVESPKIININSATYPLSITAKGVNLEIKDVFDGKIFNTQLKDGKTIKISDERIKQLLISNMELFEEIQLNPNHPNPFNSSTNISFYIPDSRYIEIKVYDMLGREVEVLVNEIKSKGTHTVIFNGDKLSSGTYFIKMKVDDKIFLRKVLLLK